MNLVIASSDLPKCRENEEEMVIDLKYGCNVKNLHVMCKSFPALHFTLNLPFFQQHNSLYVLFVILYMYEYILYIFAQIMWNILK